MANLQLYPTNIMHVIISTKVHSLNFIFRGNIKIKHFPAMTQCY